MSLDELYRRVIMDHYQKPRNRGRIEEGSVTVDLNNPTCGDRISIQMHVDEGKIREAKFLGEGCSISMASASMMTEAVKDLTLEEALHLVDLFSKMVQGEEVIRMNFRWKILKPFRVSPSSRPASNVRRWHGRLWRKG